MLLDLARLQLDLLGARSELALSVAASGWLERVAPPAPRAASVITLPGFLASDRSLARLNGFLQRCGYCAESWMLGRNLGPQGKRWGEHLDALEAHLGQRIQALADTTGHPVALVGQSLGGAYARELAWRLESCVDRVIMLGAPTFHPYRGERHNRVIGRLSEWLSRRPSSELSGGAGLLHLDAERPALPCVAIYSPIDGVVDERSCRIPEYLVDQSGPASPRENLRVLSTHIGMGVSPWVWLAVADRLAQSRRDWQPFNPERYFGGPLATVGAAVYPRPRPRRSGNPLRGFVEAHSE